MASTSGPWRRVRVWLGVCALAPLLAGGCGARSARALEPPPAPVVPSPSAPGAPVPAAPSSGGQRLHALVINGGGSVEDNYHSHLVHLQQVTALLLKAGVPRDRITVLASDGANPAPDVAARREDPEDFWRLLGTGLDRWLAEPMTYLSSSLPGFDLLPATRATVSAWFDKARTRLGPGDTLLLYVTDHGTKGVRDALDNRITLWGRTESLSVRQLRGMVARLRPGVRVVALMSQCFSGGFARLAQAQVNGEGRPTGAACGYFSSTPDRPAYGCYPEVAARDQVGHSFEMFQALAARGGRLPAAHEAVLIRDQTPDVPLRSSDAFLADALGRIARSEGKGEDEFVDALLASRAGAPPAGKDDGDGPGIERIARTFGLPTPRSLAEIAETRTRLDQLRQGLEQHARLWDVAVDEANAAAYDELLRTHPGWAARLRPAVLRRLTPTARRALVAELTAALAAGGPSPGAAIAGTGKGGPANGNGNGNGNGAGHAGPASEAAALWKKAAAARDAAYRMEVREAALLRLRAALTTRAGQAYLASGESPADRAAFEALRACEDLVLPLARTGAPEAADSPTALPSLEEDARLVEAVHPGWLGVAFAPVPPRLRARLHLSVGASAVTQVVPGSPAAVAGLQVGDIVVGEDGRPFSRPNQIRAWAMLGAIGRPRKLETIRQGERRVVTVTLVRTRGPRSR